MEDEVEIGGIGGIGGLFAVADIVGVLNGAEEVGIVNNGSVLVVVGVAVNKGRWDKVGGSWHMQRHSAW